MNANIINSPPSKALLHGSNGVNIITLSRASLPSVVIQTQISCLAYKASHINKKFIIGLPRGLANRTRNDGFLSPATQGIPESHLLQAFLKARFYSPPPPASGGKAGGFFNIVVGREMKTLSGSILAQLIEKQRKCKNIAGGVSGKYQTDNRRNIHVILTIY